MQAIGTRTTRIATGVKREVMIPNSQIGDSQVVDYSYPDPSYHVLTDVDVAYTTNTDQVHKVITDAVRSVDGVLPDKPVNVFFAKPKEPIKMQTHILNGGFMRAFTIVLILLAFGVMTAACVTSSTTTAPTITPTITVSPTGQPEPDDVTGNRQVVAAAEGVATAVIARTPKPTSTPGIIEKGVDTVTDATGLTGEGFLGLSTDDWIELAASILIILIGYIVIKLIVDLIKRLLKNSSMKMSKVFIQNLGDELTWLLMLILVRFVVFRLDFLSDTVRTALTDLFFFLGLSLITVIAFKVINLFFNNYEDTLDDDDRQRLTPMMLTIRRLTQLVVLILVVSLGLSHFGISSNVLSATIILVGLIIALGARGVVTDAISGFIILADQPFRVGDAIYIKDLDRRGNVLEIGTRSTRILTEFNREVIIPNSTIGGSEVINYSYPDPSYRLEIDLAIPYDADMDQVHQLLHKAVCGVDGVLSDKPVDVLYLGYGDYARSISVRWWIANYEQEWTMTDKVNRAMQVALNGAGIDIPFPKYDLNVREEAENDSHAAPPPPANSRTTSNS